MLISFVSGVAVASIIWFLFYQPAVRELTVQSRAPLMPGALGDSLLPKLNQLRQTAAAGATPKKTPLKMPEAVEDPPIPGAVESRPIADMTGEAPIPEAVGNTIVFDTVEEPPISGGAENQSTTKVK